MYRSIAGLAALSFALVATALPAPVMARSHGHVIHTQGPHGGGVTRSRSVSRQPGSVAVDRSVQTNRGRGYETGRSRTCAPGACSSVRSIDTNSGRGATTARSTAWGDGRYAHSRSTTTNGGRSYTRSTSATANGD
jgi:hypothetical protein